MGCGYGALVRCPGTQPCDADALALRRYDLIIADEITASLDPDTSGQVMENLLALPCMVVAITHDVSGAFMKQFDKVYRVEHGSVTQA